MIRVRTLFVLRTRDRPSASVCLTSIFSGSLSIFRPTIPPKELLLSSLRVVAEVAEGALRLFSARVRGSPYCGVHR